MTTNSDYESLKDFYRHHIHSAFHSAQAINKLDQAMDSDDLTSDQDKPLPSWIEEAMMDDDEWMDAKVRKMIEKQKKESNK